MNKDNNLNLFFMGLIKYNNILIVRFILIFFRFNWFSFKLLYSEENFYIFLF